MDFNSLEKNIFSEKNGKVFIGGEEIKPDFLDVLKTQAHNLRTSELYEILMSTFMNEAYDIALNQSGKSGSIEEDVRFAKAIKHVVFMLDAVLFKLKNK